MTRTRSRNDKDVRGTGDHGQWVSTGAGQPGGHLGQPDPPYRQGGWACSHSTVFIRIVAAATINFALSFVRLLFEGGYYSMCGYYSNKYGTCTWLINLVYVSDSTITRLFLWRFIVLKIVGLSRA